MKNLKLIYLSAITESVKHQIWDILCEVDSEFFPPLSSRELSVKSQLLPRKVTTDVKPHAYFEEMIKQDFIVAFNEDSEEVAGFMTFMHGYQCEELANLKTKSNYVTTVCVPKSYRGNGITKEFYRYILDGNLPAHKQEKFLTTRTWSTNHSHLSILHQFGFETVTKLDHHHGEGVDTLYFAKKVASL
ncbi:hypothetical protein FIU87_00920 [Bacillus sp. THAF10]|uniref:GNAT family N-acetyltransferase n=1 Tax=Bacillus sp. THAF10 TaxID=2587848 RepID=UPI00126896FC|nr:GNAT family N-acetyltransferase [Bacillus sp. THAF10]QFT87224.1 hypothetical protein FIU87_00920 [Bacillus sp. THAF10]